MKGYKLFKLPILVAALWIGSGCTKDFEDLNTNPNNPGLDQALPDQLLTTAIENMTDRVHEIFLGHEMGSCWAQQMAKVQYTDEDRYEFRGSVVNNTWASFYATSGRDIEQIYKLGVASGNETYQGVALVLKCYVASVLTDLHGDVPYSEAWRGDEGILSPAYDTQESIYRDMIQKLDDANTLLDPDGDEIAGDILYGNDILMWKKFANSLRLRLLLRMSDRDAAYVTTRMTAIVSAPATYPIFESNEDNASLAYLGSAPNNNPINENRKTRDDHRVSANFINLLDGYGDYRVMLYAKPSDEDDEFVGLPNGLTSDKAAAFNGGGISHTSKIGDFFSAATAPGKLMSYAELNFILAEAAKKGYLGTPNDDATAQTYYEAGVTAAFEEYETPLQEIFDAHDGGTYGGRSIDPGYSVDDELDYALQTGAPYDPANALRLIAEQRYIAMFDQGLQSWFEWRRTGFPVLTPAEDGTNGGLIPVRVPYPLDEVTRNKSHMNEAIARQGADNLNTRVWWDIN